MIDVKQIAKQRQSGSGTSSTGSGYGVSGKIADEAKHAAKADLATHAEQAEYANRAGMASRAVYADKAQDLAEESPAYEHFLRKDTEDTAAERITFGNGLALGDAGRLDADGIGQLFQMYLEGDSNGVQTSNVVSGNFSQADKTGYWVTSEDGTGHSYMELDKLYVRYKAVFDELEIRKRTYVGGNAMFSNAASKITAVEWQDKDGNVTSSITDITAFKCHLKTDDGTTQTQNLWRVDDLALCQTFNLKAKNGEKVENKAYWRKVTEVGDDYVCLSNVEGEYEGFGVDHANDAALYGDGTKVLLAGGDAVVTEEEILTADDGTSVPADFPEAEDAIVQCGNTTDTTRQNMIELLTYTPATDSVVYGGCVAPALIQYKGISGFTLRGKARTVISPSGNVFRAKSFIVELDGESRRLPVDFGEWEEGKEYPYCARVSHGGCLWLLDKIAEDGKSTEEPKEGSDAWTLQVSRGMDGKDGNGLNVNGTVVEHFASFTAYKNAIKEDHSGEEDPYFVLESGRVVMANSAVLLDTGADYEEDHDGDVQQGTEKPSILTYTNDAIYDYDIAEASVPDAYMDGGGVLWVASKDKWTNAGTIKGEKGDKGADAEWMEVECYVLGDGIISSVSTDKDGKPKLAYFAVRLVRHVGSTGTVVPATWSVPSQNEYGVELGSGCGFATVRYGKLTVDEMTFTARYKGKDYSKAIPIVRDGQTGDTGADGEDATDVVMMPETLVFDTDDEGTLASAASQTVTIQPRKGGKPLAWGDGCRMGDVEGVNIAEDGYGLALTDENTYTLTVDPKKILHYEKDGLKLPYTDGYVGMTLTVGDTVLVKRVMFRVNYAKYMGTFALTQKEFKTDFEAYKSTTDGTISKHESLIKQNAESITAKVSTDDMVKAGITIDKDGVVLEGDKVQVKNGDKEAAVFKEGKLNAELINAKQLTSTGDNGAVVRIFDGRMQVSNKFGIVNMVFGLDDNGMAVLSYYDNNGNLLYDLGPNGISSSDLDKAKIKECKVVRTSAIGLDEPFGEQTTVVTGRNFKKLQPYYVATYNNSKKLFGNKETLVGYEYEFIYKYTAPRMNGVILPDTDNGLGGQLSKQADGMYFTTNKDFVDKDGNLQNLATGEFFDFGQTIYDNTKGHIPVCENGDSMDIGDWAVIPRYTMANAYRISQGAKTDLDEPLICSSDTMKYTEGGE